VSAVMLTARTCPTLSALILRLLVLKPGPITTMPEPWLATESNALPPGGTVTWCKQCNMQLHQHDASIYHASACMSSGPVIEDSL